MIRAGVRNVKDHLSEYLRRIRQRERVVISKWGRPVAVFLGLEDQKVRGGVEPGDEGRR